MQLHVPLNRALNLRALQCSSTQPTTNVQDIFQMSRMPNLLADLDRRRSHLGTTFCSETAPDFYSATVIPSGYAVPLSSRLTGQ